mgnify:CR=1 FL=1
MSIMSSPFDLSADIFTQKYSAVIGEELSSGASYNTPKDALKAWRNCQISTSELKSIMRDIHADAPAWNGNDWDDFMENAPNKFFRLSVGKEVRLKHAYYIMCKGFKKDKDGNVLEITCTYDSSTKGGWSDDGRKVKGTIHWVSAHQAIDAEVRLYDRLFDVENPELDNIDLNSRTVIKNAKLEPSLGSIEANRKYQFLRLGYFVLDKDSKKGNLVFNQSVPLRSNWKKKNLG